MELQCKQDLVQAMLMENIRLVCRTTIPHTSHLVLEASIKITTDDKHVYEININETINKKTHKDTKKIKKVSRGKQTRKPEKKHFADDSDTDNYGSDSSKTAKNDMIEEEENEEEEEKEQEQEEGVKVKEEHSDWEPDAHNTEEDGAPFTIADTTDVQIKQEKVNLCLGSGHLILLMWKELKIAPQTNLFFFNINLNYIHALLLAMCLLYVIYVFLPLSSLGCWGIVIISVCLSVCLSVYPSIHPYF